MKKLILPIIVFFFLVNLTFAVAPPDFCVRVFVLERKEKSIGSGILISENQVLTNWHVVRDRKNDNAVEIQFTDWTAVDGKVIKIHKMWDLALIEIEKTNRKPAVFGEPAKVDEIARIHGYGYGVPGSSCGVVFSVEKGVLVVKWTAARFGDSGGCIVNLQGEVVGILFGQLMEHTYGTDVIQIQKFLKD